MFDLSTLTLTVPLYIADAVLNQRLTIAPVTSVLRGEYGVKDVALSVPSIIGVSGIERRLEERWSNEEYYRFRETEKRLKEVIKSI